MPIAAPRARRRAALTAFAVALFALVLPRAAEAAPAPDTGPSRGGTLVADVVPEVRITAVAAGGTFSVGLGSDGLLYSWGLDSDGQLGDGPGGPGQTAVPVRVATPAGTTFTQVAAGAGHALALATDGTVYAWGGNSLRQVGDAVASLVETPRPVGLPSGATVAALAAGFDFSAVLTTDGRVLSWGSDIYGQLGDGQIGGTSATPVQAAMPAGVTVTGIMQHSPEARHVLVLGSDGLAYSWGAQTGGTLGHGVTGGPDEPTPAPVLAPPGVTFTRLSAGGSHSLAVATDGTVYAWGSDAWGQLGDGSAGSATGTPTAVPAFVGRPAVDVAAGLSNAAALTADGAVYGWGTNDSGTVGDGTVGDGANPNAPVLVPTAAALPAGVQITSLALDYHQALAVAADGTTYAWGDLALGVGGPVLGQRLVPTAIPDAVAVEQVTFGGVPGTGLSATGGSWTAAAPGGCGAVDVVVDYRLWGGPLQQQVAPGGFTYVGSAPAIVQQPASVAVDPGATATLTVVADGEAPPTVRWQQRGTDGTWTDLAGATGDTLTLTPAATTDVRALATNCWGTATSAVATVAVAAPAAPSVPAAPAPAAPAPDPSAPAATGTTGPLAVTGADALPTALAAAALAVTGCVLLLTTRRARRR